MNSQEAYEAIPIGFDLGTLEMVLDEDTVKDRIGLVQWEGKGLLERGIVPPGLTIAQHAHMKFAALPALRVGIWAKSEHEFLRPMKLGSKVLIRGKVVDKYTKRGRNYMVTEMETVNEANEVLMRSRETSVYVE